MGSRHFEIGLIAVYGLVVFGMIPFHEPWRDEAQAWLIARDLDLPGVLAQMRYELSPPLWHLVLWPFAQLGFPFAIAHILNAAIAVGAVAIVALGSPFARWQKLAFAGCFLMAFEYGVVARSYAASVLIGVAIAALHSRRFERPGAYALLILALGATNLHALVLAIGIGFASAWELARRPGAGVELLRSRGAIAALSGAGILAVWAATSGLIWHIARMAGQLGFQGFDPAGALLSLAFLSPFPPTGWTTALALAALVAVVWQLRRNPPALMVLLLPVAVYTLSPLSRRVTFRHAGFILLATLVALWIDRRARADASPGAAAGVAEPWWRRFARSSGGIAGILVFGCLAFTMTRSVGWLHGEVIGLSSAGRAMAHYIAAQEIRGPIAARRASTASALLPYLPGRRIWFADSGTWGTFVTWESGVFASQLPEFELMTRLQQQFGDERPWLLSNRPLRQPERYGYALDHAEDQLGPTQRGREVYFLYQPRYW